MGKSVRYVRKQKKPSFFSFLKEISWKKYLGLFVLLLGVPATVVLSQHTQLFQQYASHNTPLIPAFSSNSSSHNSPPCGNDKGCYKNRYTFNGYYQENKSFDIADHYVNDLRSFAPLAVKASTLFNATYNSGTDPQMLVWWSAIEGIDANTHASNCDNGQYDHLNQVFNCDDGNWQVGVGAQFRNITGWGSSDNGLLENAFKDMVGDPNDADLVWKTGKDVIDQERGRITDRMNGKHVCENRQSTDPLCNFPHATVSEIMKGVNPYGKNMNNWYASVLIRDPRIGAYTTLYELQPGDINKWIAGGWDESYTKNWDYEFSRMFWAIFNNWQGVSNHCADITNADKSHTHSCMSQTECEQQAASRTKHSRDGNNGDSVEFVCDSAYLSNGCANPKPYCAQVIPKSDLPKPSPTECKERIMNTTCGNKVAEEYPDNYSCQNIPGDIQVTVWKNEDCSISCSKADSQKPGVCGVPTPIPTCAPKDVKACGYSLHENPHGIGYPECDDIPDNHMGEFKIDSSCNRSCIDTNPAYPNGYHADVDGVCGYKKPVPVPTYADTCTNRQDRQQVCSRLGQDCPAGFATSDSSGSARGQCPMSRQTCCVKVTTCADRVNALFNRSFNAKTDCDDGTTCVRFFKRDSENPNRNDPYECKATSDCPAHTVCEL